MKKMNYLGLLSLLSLIAILGWQTGNTGLYGFFGFAYYIRYFWVIPDELFQENVRKPFAIRVFEPPWGKRKAPAFVSKAGTYYGAEGEICLSSLDTRRSARL